MLLAATDSYFSDDASLMGFSKYRTFIPSSKLGVYISESINNRIAPKSVAYEQDFQSLFNLLVNQAAVADDFFKLIDDLRAEGIAQMVKRHQPFQQYHTAEHAEELAFDVEVVLAQQYGECFPHEDLANRILIAIAKAAAAWHDVEQTLGPPGNEIESAKGFAHEFSLRLILLSTQYPQHAQLINALQQHLIFISNELIVNATWLILGLDARNQLTAKTLRQYNELVINDLKEKNAAVNEEPLPFMQRLLIASKAISQGDTTRFAFPHVKEKVEMLRELQNMPVPINLTLEKFFALASLITDAEKEVFLGLHCQDLRMFPELNFPFIETKDKPIPLHSAHISQEDYDAFIQAFQIHRKFKEPTHLLNHAHLIDIFFNTKNVKPNPNDEKRNIERERIFALSLNNEIWDRHAHNLQVLDDYYATLNEDQRAHLAKVLFTLATHCQPGSKLLKHDTAVRLKLA